MSTPLSKFSFVDIFYIINYIFFIFTKKSLPMAGIFGFWGGLAEKFVAQADEPKDLQ